VAFYVIVFMLLGDFTATEKAVLFLAIGTVITAEAVNTAIENLTDLVSPQKHPLAANAKDAAAGAVLLSAIAAAAVGISIFGNIETLTALISRLKGNLALSVFLILSVGLWVFAIVFPSAKIKKSSEDTVTKTIDNTDKENENE
jgi:diacylglycerol kinase